MGRKPRVARSAEEEWQIVHEGLKSGNMPETCRRYGIAPIPFHRWKDDYGELQGASRMEVSRGCTQVEKLKENAQTQLTRP